MLLRRTTRSEAIAGGGLAAGPGGVWITYRSGMLGQAERLDAATLTRTAPTPRALASPDTTYDETMGVGVTVSEGVGWVTAVRSLTCVDPITAALRSTDTIQVGSVVSAGGRLYSGTPKGMSVIEPPTACYR